MTDDLDQLRAALRAATPEPGKGAKDRALHLAMENFDRAQGSASAPRHSQDRPIKAGSLNGVRKMLNKLTSRPMLAATTSVAALCLGLFVVLPLSDGQLPLPAPKPQAAMSGDTQVAPDLEPVIVGETADGYAAAPAMRVKRALLPPAPRDALAAPQENTEAFANAAANPVRIAAEDPVSTFSIDVDTASYAVVRSSLMGGEMPPPEAVRIEEMINYFPYAYPAPAAGEAPFRQTVTVTPSPWNSGNLLVHIGIQGRLPAVEDRPALNLVFLIDTSGSMQDDDKLPLLKQSFRLMLAQLWPDDQVAIVAYAGSAGQVLAPTRAEDRASILAALDRLDAGGSTAGEEGLQQAYGVAETMAAKGEVSRIILATDGDFNVGISDPEALTSYIAAKRDTGVYLSVLGFGRGNLDDATMQALAQNGNGQAAYIDTLNEARKVLVDQLTGALFPIANDVKIQVEWNPATVTEYRLIGYETRALQREDFNNDKVDAGEIGAGHSVTAIYEVTPVGSPAALNDPLRYGTAAPASGDASGELGFLRLRYKAPGETVSALIEAPIPNATSDASPDVNFGLAIAGFGQLLTGGKYLGDWGWDQAIALAIAARGEDPFGYRVEAVNLMRLAQTLSR
jgi:Ca-activated chloride channel homolog